MKILKRITKKIFYKIYQINPADDGDLEGLFFVCEGRIVRSLSESKKKVCGTYILHGLER